MHCPYCISEIDAAALACPRCARDLYLFKPLLEKLSQLEKAVADQAKAAAAGAEERIAALERGLAEIRAERAVAIPVEVEVRAEPVPAPPVRYAGSAALAVLAVLVLLLTAHGVLLFVYDVKPLYLRIATLLIPMPFAFLLARQCPGRLGPSSVAGFAVAGLAVLGMLSITSVIDKVPLLPQDARDWRETFEYVAGIGLAFMAGGLAGEHFTGHKLSQVPKNKVVLLIAKAVTPNEDGEFGIERVAKRIDKVAKAAAPVATGATSLLVGLKAFMGSLG